MSTHNIIWGEIFDCVGANDTSTLVGHFVSSPREREKRRATRGDERGTGEKRKGIEEIKNIPPPSILTCCKGSGLCPAVSQYQLDAPVM